MNRSHVIALLLVVGVAGCGGGGEQASPPPPPAGAAPPGATLQPSPVVTPADMAQAPASPSAVAPAPTATGAPATTTTVPSSGGTAAPPTTAAAAPPTTAAPATTMATTMAPATTTAPAPAATPAAAKPGPSRPQPKGPITLPAKLGAVTFDHGKHAGERKVACTTCHHPSKPEKPLARENQACRDCHTQPATAPMKVSLQGAFHDARATRGTCIDCHKAAVAKGEKSPLKCVECHKKK